jgi:hypothetical protein
MEHLLLESKIARKISELSQTDWQKAFPDILESYHFFKSLDEAQCKQFSFYYILIYQGADPVGAASCFCMDYSLATSIEGPLKNALLWLKRNFAIDFSLKALICGSSACEGRIGVIGENQPRVLGEILKCMEQIAQAERASILAFKDFSRQYLPLLDNLHKQGFAKIKSYPSAELAVEFASFEEYLSSLSRSTRKDLKRKFKRISELPKLDLKVSNSLDGCLDTAYDLYLGTLAKSEVQFEIMPKAFFARIFQNMPQESKFFLWHLEGKLVAFDLCLARNGVLVDEYIGLDYRFAYQYHLYFLTFRDILTWCIENGIKRYETGALSYEPKKRLGLEFVPMFVYAKHRNKLLNPFFKLLCSFLRPERFDPILQDLFCEKNDEKKPA